MKAKDKPEDESEYQGDRPPRTYRDLSPTKVLLLFVVALGVLYFVLGNYSHDRVPVAVAFRASFSEAAPEAQASGKVIFADFYADWCGPCQAMDREVFSRKDFAESLEQIAVPLRVDLETREGEALARQYRIEAIPAFVVMRPDGQDIGRGGSEASAETLLNFVRRCSKAAGSSSDSR